MWEEPKTKKSKAPVPVIFQLSERFELHRELSGNPEIGLMFPSPLGTPINLDALAEDVIRPALEKADWPGMVGMLSDAAWPQIFIGLA